MGSEGQGGHAWVARGRGDSHANILDRNVSIGIIIVM